VKPGFSLAFLNDMEAPLDHPLPSTKGSQMCHMEACILACPRKQQCSSVDYKKSVDFPERVMNISL